jgi:TRAP-type C4-dicarboxylate transport system substrate-binding protein
MQAITRTKAKAVRLAAAVLTLTAVGIPAMAQTRFNYASGSPSKGPEAIAANRYMDKVEQVLGSGFKFERSFDGTVANFRATGSSLRDGLIDGGFLLDTFHTADLKTSMTITDLAMLVADPLAQAGAMNETMLLNCPQCEADFARLKAMPLAYNGVAPFYLQCRGPVASLQDIKGKAVRAASAFGLFAKAAGANPVSTVPTEVYEAMQRGAVECAIAGGVWLKSYNLADVVKTVVDQPLGQYNASLVMAVSRDGWKRLSAQQRQAMIDALPFLVAEATLLNIEETGVAFQEAAKKGIRRTPAAADMKALLASHVAGEQARVTADAEKRNVANPAVLVKTYLDKLDKWSRIVAETGGDRAKYEEALRREIFSKLKP